MPEVGFCKDCRFWELQAWKGMSWGHCERARGKDGDAVHGDSLAVAQDMEDYGAYLETHETFGCVMFQPKT